MATRYLIKVTCTEGVHAGYSYLLRKGGYVTDEGRIEWFDTTYATEGIAKRICRKLFEENELNRRIEEQDEAARIKRGFSPKGYRIYTAEKYEPYPVNAVEDI